MSSARLSFRRPVEGRAYVAGIDGLRAVAVVAVMAYHLNAALLPGGFVGVDVFFVISGYVVTGSLLRDRELPVAGFLARFYARRLRRIAPALMACLSLTVVASISLIPGGLHSPLFERTGLLAFVGLSNFALLDRGGGYFDPRSEYNPFTHTWSLAVEEQFYLLFPIVIYLWLARPATARGRVSRAAFLALCGGSLALCAAWNRLDPSLAYYMLPSRFWELGTGAGLACLLANQPGRASQAALRAPWLGLCGVLLLLVALVFARPAAFPFPWALPAVIGTALIILAVSQDVPKGVLVQILSARPMIAVGLLSYSLYLWHWPVYVLCRWTVGLDSPLLELAAVGATAVLGYVSYRWIEQPFQSGAAIRRLPSRHVVAAGLALVAAGWVNASNLYRHARHIELSAVSKSLDEWYPSPSSRRLLPASVVRQCDVRVTAGTGALKQRTFTPVSCVHEAARVRLFVAGDSHASAYLALLHMFTAATGIEVIAFANPGCAVARLLSPAADELMDDKDKPGCVEFQRRVVEAISAQAGAGDVVMLASLQIPRMATPWTRPEPRESGVNGSSAPDPGAEQEANRIIRNITTKEGLHVVLAAPLPVFPAPPFRCADPFNRMNPVCRAGFSVPRQVIEQRRRAAMQAIERIVAGSQSVSVWDPLPYLCGTQDCLAFRDGHPLFYDNDHLSGFGNELLFLPFLAFVCGRLNAGCA